MGLTPPPQLAFFLPCYSPSVLSSSITRTSQFQLLAHSFETLLVGFLILLAGVLFRGF
jgi:hypothetical protein